MPPGLVLSAEFVRRLRALLRQAESQGADLTGPRRAGRGPVIPAPLFYRIELVVPSPVGQYVLRRQEWNTSTRQFQDVTDADHPEYNLDVTAWDILGRGDGAVDDRVLGWKLYVGTTWLTLIDLTAALGVGRVFPVKVLKDGGVAGGEATECTYTYTVKDFAGTILNKKRDGTGDPATAMTPATPRQHFLEYWYGGETRTTPPGATSTYGEAIYDGNDLVLLRCLGELPKDSPCA